MKQGQSQRQKPADRVTDVRPYGVNHPEPVESKDQVTVDSVTCQNFEQHIHVLLDSRTSLLTDELIQQHASICSPCAGILADYESLDDSVSKISVAALSQIAGVDLQEVPPAKSQFAELSRALFFVTSIAAVLLIAIAAGLGEFGSTDGQTGFAHLNHTQSNTIAFADNELTDNELAGSDLATNELSSAASAPRMRLPETARSNQFSATPLRLPEIRKAALSVAFHQSEIDVIEPFLNPVETTVETMKAKNAQSWKQLSKQLDPIGPILRISAELPGLRSVHESVNVTFNLIQQTFSRPLPAESKPLDFSFNPELVNATA